MNDFARDLSDLLLAGLIVYLSVTVALSWRRDEMRQSLGRWERARRALGDACGFPPGSRP